MTTANRYRLITDKKEIEKLRNKRKTGKKTPLATRRKQTNVKLIGDLNKTYRTDYGGKNPATVIANHLEPLIGGFIVAPEDVVINKKELIAFILEREQIVRTGIQERSEEIRMVLSERLIGGETLPKKRAK